MNWYKKATAEDYTPDKMLNQIVYFPSKSESNKDAPSHYRGKTSE